VDGGKRINLIITLKCDKEKHAESGLQFMLDVRNPVFQHTGQVNAVVHSLESKVLQMIT
jgi:hypothetical protein